jgi:hypothetical protein
MARTMKRIAVKSADLGLAREANSLEKRALSALRKRQSSLDDPRLSRDNLDENGERRSECEAAAGSGNIIFPGVAVRKHFLGDAIRDHVTPSNGRFAITISIHPRG